MKINKIMDLFYFHIYFSIIHLVSVYNRVLGHLVTGLKLLLPQNQVVLVIQVVKIILYLLVLFIILNYPLVFLLLIGILLYEKYENPYFLTFLFLSLAFVFNAELFYTQEILLCMDNGVESDKKTCGKAPVQNNLDIVMQNPIIRGHIATAVSEFSDGVPFTKMVCNPKMLNAFEECMADTASKDKNFLESARIRFGSKQVFKFARALCEEKPSVDNK